MSETETPIPPEVGSGRPASPLTYPDFRVLALSTVATGMAFIGETVVLGWLLLDRSDSAFIVGLGIALRALPNLLVGLPGGALSDRVDRRLLLRLLGAGSAVACLVPAFLEFGGLLTVWQLLLITFAGGALRAVGQTARQTYVFDITGPTQVAAGLAMVSLGQRLGGIASSLLVGGVLGLWGAGEAYVLLAVCNLISGALLFFARTPGQSAPVSRPPVLQGLGEFKEEVKRNRLLGILLGLTAVVEVLGFSYQTLVPSIARDVLDAGPSGLGLLTAAGSAGALLTMLGLTLRGQPRQQGLTFLVVLVFFGVALILLGVSGTLVVAVVSIAVVSGCAALSDLLTQSLLQGAVPNDLRGRAMGSWLFAIGLGPVGHLQIGAVAAAAGVTVALLVNGAALAVVGGVAIIFAARVRRI